MSISDFILVKLLKIKKFNGNEALEDVYYNKDLSKLVFKCQMREKRMNTFGYRPAEFVNTEVTLKEDYLEISKISVWKDKDRGLRRLMYCDIMSLSYNKPGYLSLNHNIEIKDSGGYDLIILESTDGTGFYEFYDILFNTVKDYKLKKRII